MAQGLNRNQFQFSSPQANCQNYHQSRISQGSSAERPVCGQKRQRLSECHYSQKCRADNLICSASNENDFRGYGPQREVQQVSAEVDTGAAVVEDPPTYVKAPGRVVAIGDIHGDIQKTFLALALAGVLREGVGKEPLWCGGDTTVVQLGDVLDRGSREIGVLMLLRDLDRQARLEGGAVYMLNGNHESMNVSGNYRYVTEGAMQETAITAGLTGADINKKQFQIQARTRLFSPGAPIAMELAKNPAVLIVNDTMFAHGGVLPAHVTYGLEKMNKEVAAWMRGDLVAGAQYSQPPYIAMGGADSVMWNRDFGKEGMNSYDRLCTCSLLRVTLRMVGVERMVVGHTPQAMGANCECNGQVWRMDVGMSSGVLNAVPQILEIKQELNGESSVELKTAPLALALGSSRMLNTMAPFRPRSQLAF